MAPVVGKVPAIRFKGYDAPWVEEPLLGRIEKIIDFRGRTPKKLGYEWSQSGYLALSALNVKDGLIDFTADANYGDAELYETWMSGNELHRNQVLFTTEAPMGNVAQVPDDAKYILSQRTIAFVADDQRLSDDYLAVSLKSPSVFRELLARASGGTAKGVSQKTLSSVNTVICDNINEQAKIGAYFKALDLLIALQQRKHDKLVTLKQAMLQKLFPKDGASTPEIRFKGFEGDWAPKTVDFLSSRHDNLRIPISAINRTPGVTPYYGANGIQDYVEGHTHDGEFILVAEDGANDTKNYPVQYVNGKVWVNNHAHVLQAKEGVADNRFLKYAFAQVDFEEFLVGGGRSKLNAETMMKIVLSVPVNVKEQQKIGTYFRQLDALISQHATQLSKLKQIKAACLEKMFV